MHGRTGTGMRRGATCRAEMRACLEEEGEDRQAVGASFIEGGEGYERKVWAGHGLKRNRDIGGCLDQEFDARRAARHDGAMQRRCSQMDLSESFDIISDV